MFAVGRVRHPDISMAGIAMACSFDLALSSQLRAVPVVPCRCTIAAKFADGSPHLFVLVLRLALSLRIYSVARLRRCKYYILHIG